jgi:hypothetical protein
VIVVGAGNSAVEIAVELAGHARVGVDRGAVGAGAEDGCGEVVGSQRPIGRVSRPVIFSQRCRSRPRGVVVRRTRVCGWRG